MSARDQLILDLYYDERCTLGEIATFLRMRERGVARVLRVFA